MEKSVAPGRFGPRCARYRFERRPEKAQTVRRKTRSLSPIRGMRVFRLRWRAPNSMYLYTPPPVAEDGYFRDRYKASGRYRCVNSHADRQTDGVHLTLGTQQGGWRTPYASNTTRNCSGVGRYASGANGRTPLSSEEHHISRRVDVMSCAITRAPAMQQSRLTIPHVAVAIQATQAGRNGPASRGHLIPQLRPGGIQLGRQGARPHLYVARVASVVSTTHAGHFRTLTENKGGPDLGQPPFRQSLLWGVRRSVAHLAIIRDRRGAPGGETPGGTGGAHACRQPSNRGHVAGRNRR